MSSTRPTLDEDSAETRAWRSLLARAGRPLAGVDPDPASPSLTDAAAGDAFVDLYLPLCRPGGGESHVLGHLGQSIDGYVATAGGDSNFVNDRENIRHLHRLRALHDAVIVGAETIAFDNPQLTTRLVPGANPVRVVLDPRRRLPVSARVFTDGAAPTLLVAADETGGGPSHGQADVLSVPARDGRFDLHRLIGALAERGLRRLFVEGGGTTVSAFFDAGLLDRLHLAVAPVFTGRGKPGLRLPETERLRDCPRPAHRVFTMGRDILFDCELSASSEGPEPSGGADAPAAIRRVR